MRIEVRVHPSEKSAIEQLASAAGISVSELVRRRLSEPPIGQLLGALEGRECERFDALARLAKSIASSAREEAEKREQVHEAAMGEVVLVLEDLRAQLEALAKALTQAA